MMNTMSPTILDANEAKSALFTLQQELVTRQQLLKSHGVSDVSGLPENLQPPFVAVAFDCDLFDLTGATMDAFKMLVR